jgi:uncharacterized protein
MTIQTVLLLLLIGVGAGTLSGYVGVGGGIIIVPALTYLIGMQTKEATGTSLFILCIPVVFLGLRNYWLQGQVNWKYGLVIAVTFVIGNYIGAKLNQQSKDGMVKLIFGMVMLISSFLLIRSGFIEWKQDE